MCDEAKTEQRESIQSQTDYRQSVLIIGMCLDLRSSSKKLLLLKSVRTLLRKKEKSEQGTSAFGHNILNTAHSENAQKDIPFQRKKNLIYFFNICQVMQTWVLLVHVLIVV